MSNPSKSDRMEREWLLKLAESVASRLRDEAAPDALKVAASSKMVCWETNTDGWYVAIGRFRGDRGGEFQVWLDRWTGAEGRRVCLCYKSLRCSRMRSLGQAGTVEFGPATIWTDSSYQRVKPATLRTDSTTSEALARTADRRVVQPVRLVLLQRIPRNYSSIWF